MAILLFQVERLIPSFQRATANLKALREAARRPVVVNAGLLQTVARLMGGEIAANADELADMILDDVLGDTVAQVRVIKYFSLYSVYVQCEDVAILTCLTRGSFAKGGTRRWRWR